MQRLLALLLRFGACAGVSLKLPERFGLYGTRQSSGEQRGHKVHVEFFVMSKCPDAIACERAFGPVLQEMSDSVNVSFEYIRSTRGGAAECMHGPSECEGNVQQLCAQAEAGSAAQLLDFVLCQGQNPSQIPQNGEECFAHAGYNTSRMMACADGAEGQDMLLKSFDVSQSLGVRVSCTVQINGQAFCAHDSDWVDCGACDAYADKGLCLRGRICELDPEAC
uniref:Uncharacterized protein n=1 Tax=Alexandrium monilatum TaxID=311494 RepID=A0A7S4QR38_9DINO|mmetsp:Transcript_102384/g.305772  ORF Transcript_102384/g.305772 Transcript_102384/m.305772 type:complete len:222 (-) Transcript_102384:85-750(-)